jgi:uncharacterized phiE125 gp8 family phage protein
VEPISLAEAKSHLRVDFSDDDAYITALISVARDYAEGYQKRSLGTCTLELTQDYFTNPIYLEEGPVQSVTSVSYTRLDGTIGTVPNTSYILTVDGKLVPKSFWPVDSLQNADAVKVVYTAGPTAIDPSTKQGMLLLIGHWYEYREPVLSGKTVANLPFSAKQLLHMGKAW